jgi:hypothetical protein
VLSLWEVRAVAILWSILLSETLSTSNKMLTLLILFVALVPIVVVASLAVSDSEDAQRSRLPVRDDCE